MMYLNKPAKARKFGQLLPKLMTLGLVASVPSLTSPNRAFAEPADPDARVAKDRPADKTSARMDEPSPDADALPYVPLNPVEPQIILRADPRTVALLAEALPVEVDPARRAHLAGDLGLCATPEARAALLRALVDTDQVVRAAAVRAVASFVTQEPALTKLVDDLSPLVRRELIDAKLEGAIIRGLTDPDLAVLTAAVTTSVSPATDKAIADRIATLPPHLQSAACRTLARRNAADAAAAIVPLLQSNNIVARVAAIDALGGLHQLSAEQIRAQANHPAAAARRSAAMAIATLKETGERLALARQFLADKDPTVRLPAVEQLGALGDVDSISPLAAQLTADYPPLRLGARDALVKVAQQPSSEKSTTRPSDGPTIDTSSAGSAFSRIDSIASELLVSPDKERRIDGSFILGRLRSKSRMTEHVALVGDADFRVARQAAESLGRIGDSESGPALLALARRCIRLPVPMQTANAIAAGEQAILACARVGYRPVLVETDGIITNIDAPTPYRTAGLWALGRLGDAAKVQQAATKIFSGPNAKFEQEVVKVEVVRAFGNARATGALKSLQKQRDANPGSLVSVAANDAINHINGTNAPLVVPPVVQPPLTLIEAANPAAN